MLPQGMQHTGQGFHLFCRIRFVISNTLGESASGRMLMQVDRARSPSSRTHLRPALPNNYSIFRSELRSLDPGHYSLADHKQLPGLQERQMSSACLSVQRSKHQQ